MQFVLRQEMIKGIFVADISDTAKWVVIRIYKCLKSPNLSVYFWSRVHVKLQSSLKHCDVHRCEVWAPCKTTLRVNLAHFAVSTLIPILYSIIVCFSYSSLFCFSQSSSLLSIAWSLSGQLQPQLSRNRPRAKCTSELWMLLYTRLCPAAMG